MKRMLVLGALVVSLLVAGVSASAASEAWIPGLASFLLPGPGQLLNDDSDKAVTHFAVGVGIMALNMSIGWWLPYGTTYFAPVLITLSAVNLAWRIYSGWDAYKVAKSEGFTIGFVPGGVGVSYCYSF